MATYHIFIGFHFPLTTCNQLLGALSAITTAATVTPDEHTRTCNGHVLDIALVARRWRSHIWDAAAGGAAPLFGE